MPVPGVPTGGRRGRCQHPHPNSSAERPAAGCRRLLPLSLRALWGSAGTGVQELHSPRAQHHAVAYHCVYCGLCGLGLCLSVCPAGGLVSLPLSGLLLLLGVTFKELLTDASWDSHEWTSCSSQGGIFYGGVRQQMTL